MPAPHSYEEIRNVVIEILIGKEKVGYEPSQFSALVSGVAEVFSRRDGTTEGSVYGSIGARPNPHDSELVRDVFWDLFRQGYITLGLDNANANWPFFRLSHFGSRTLGSLSPNRFHDTASFIAIIRKEVPDISNDAVVYLEEAVAAFYADCLLSACVMLGVAAETEFLRLLNVAGAGSQHATIFAAAAKDGFVRTRITNFRQR